MPTLSEHDPTARIAELEEQLRRLEQERNAALAQVRELTKTLRQESVRGTRRSQAREQLQQRQERLQLFIEHAPVAIAMFDRHMRYIRASRRWHQDYGLEARSLRGLSHYDLFPEISAEWKAVHRRGLSGEVVRAEEDRFERADGSVQWLRWEVQPWRRASGEIGGIVIFAEDITARKVAEAALRESEQRLRLATEAAHIGLWEWAVETRQLVFDSNCARLFGRPDQIPVSYAVFADILHPQDRERVKKTVQEALDPNSGGRYEIEYRVVWPDDSVHWLFARGQAVFEGTGTGARPVSFSGIVMDETGRKRMEQSLRESEARFRATFEQAAVGMAHVGINGRFLRVNRKLAEITGYSGEELLQKTFMDVTYAADLDADVAQATRLLRGDIDYYQMEKRYLRKNGELVWINLTAALQRGIGGNPQFYIAVIEDISARKAMEAELIRAKKAAEEGSRAKSEFLANMSHEIRTPMTVIMAALEHLALSCTDSQQRQVMEMAEIAAERLLSLIDDILDFSRIESRRLEIAEETFDLHTCVRETVLLFELKAAEKNIRLRQEIAPQVPRLVRGDPHRLGQVLVNLIGNAVKFTECGEVAVRVEPAPAPAGGNAIRFSVRDTGIGIPADKQKLLFRSFSQVDASPTRRYSGTGLGLAISKGLVELMGGRIWVQSREGSGSTFFFVLPLVPTATEHP